MVFFVGLGFNIFLLPALSAAGGVSEISTILYSLYGWNPAVVQWGINIPVFFLGHYFLGRDLRLQKK
ncbi:YitT family protein [Metabacillus fastidiosus]|uniref:YitT family protein n=1 Tax=Metabacillus fastidiosus TaxID=1458 RepID=UPI003AF10C61